MANEDLEKRVEDKKLLNLRLKRVEEVLQRVRHENEVTVSTAAQIVEKYSFELEHAFHVLDLILAWDNNHVDIQKGKTENAE